MKTSALLFATAASEDRGSAAALRAGGATVLGRLLEQLESLGVGRVWIVTRRKWKATVEEAAANGNIDVTVVESDDVSDDLRTTAEIAAQAHAPLVVCNAHVLTHREALAGLLADPRVVSGALGTSSQARGRWSFPIRSVRGRVTSAGSPFHLVGNANGYFLGVMKVDRRDTDHLVAVSRQLADLAAEPQPEPWEEAFDRRAGEWRLRAAAEGDPGVAPDRTTAPDPASLALDRESEAELELRLLASREDAVSLLLVGLVRAGARLSRTDLGGFFYANPLSRNAANRAVEEMSGYDEGRLALDATVKAADGFFTTFFVSPYSKYVARFAARCGWSPNAVTTLSLAIGAVAAASFAVGNRASLVVGAVLLQISFTVDCVDGQLARYTRTFSNLGAWLDSVSDRGKEYLVYAGLAVGATRGFGDDVWTLAAAALTLQTVRHTADFSFAARRHQAIEDAPRLPLEQPEDAPLPIELPAIGGGAVVSAFDVDAAAAGAAVLTRTSAPVVVDSAPAAARATGDGRRPRLGFGTLGRYAIAVNRALDQRSWTRWGKRILVLPIGERLALISLTAAIATPRVTFVALLAWGGLAAVYTFTGRILTAVAK